MRWAHVKMTVVHKQVTGVGSFRGTILESHLTLFHNWGLTEKTQLHLFLYP